MQLSGRQKLGRFGIAVLAVISLFALFVTFVVVPGLAQKSGLSETAITYIVAALALLIAVGSTLAAKALNRPNIPER